MKKLELQILEDYINHINGKLIEGCGVIEDEFVIQLDDGSIVTFWSAEDLNMTVDFPPEMH